jgi:hypothetical protein
MGTVEVDETYIGGEEAGLLGKRAKGKNALVGVAVELKYRRVSAAAGWQPSPVDLPPGGISSSPHMSSQGASELGYVHHRRSQRAARGEDIPANCCRACTGSPP